jgi:hypothetical protein
VKPSILSGYVEISIQFSDAEIVEFAVQGALRGATLALNETKPKRPKEGRGYRRNN